MKRLFLTLAFFSIFYCLKAQHYGGVTFTPYAVENHSGWSDEYYQMFGGKRTTFGYAFGYQGIILSERRFSLTYGLQFSSLYKEIAYKNPINMYHSVLGSVSGITGELNEIKNIEIPIWLRYNILKGKRKFQPFLAACYIFAFKVKFRDTYYLEDQSFIIYNYSKNTYSLVDLGVGCNYRPNDQWICSMMATYSNNLARKVGLNISVMRKF